MTPRAWPSTPPATSTSPTGGNNTISKVTPAGAVSTFVSSGLTGPDGLAFDAAGNLYVANCNSITISKVTPAGAVSTFVSSGLDWPEGLAFDAAGNLYVANHASNTISKIAPPVVVEGQPFSGVVFRFTDYDPQATASDFTAVVTLGDGNTVTLDSNGVVSGPAAAGGRIVADPAGGFDVQLSYTYAKVLSNVTFAVQVTDLGGASVSASDSTFSVAPPVQTTTTVGTSQTPVIYGTPVTFTATVSAPGSSVPPSQGGVDFVDTTTGQNLGNGTYVTSNGTNSTWSLASSPKTLNVTSGDSIQATYSPGGGFAASFGTTTQAVTALPIIVTAAASTKTYDGTASSAAVPVIGDVVSTLAGSPGQIGSTSGTGGAARFDIPDGAAVDSAGNVYLADTFNDTIRKITPSGVVTTLAGAAGQTGSSDGTGTAARFFWPTGVAVDSAGDVYVADQGNDEIRKITPSGVVTTLAGTAGQQGSSNGTGTAARFYYPQGLAVDAAGNVYVSDQDNDEIRKITPSGVVTTLAGSAGQTGSSDGTGSAARFNNPKGVAVDGAGNVYVADLNNQDVRKISPSARSAPWRAPQGKQAPATARAPRQDSIGPPVSRWTTRATFTWPIPPTT